MKLDGEPLFSHTSLVHKSDSKPFQYNGDSLDTLKGGSKIMNENQNRILSDLKGCERDADPLPFEMKDGNGLWNGLEHDFSVSVDDLTNGDVNEVQDSALPEAIPSSNRVEKDLHFYTDKSVTECELPELIVHYKEPTYHVVKDICIDEGVPSQDKILVDNAKDGHMGFCTFLTPDSDKNNEMSKEKMGIVITIPDGTKFLEEKDCGGNGADRCGSKESIHTREENVDGNDKIANDVAKEKIMSENPLLVGELGIEKSVSEFSKFDGNEVEPQSVQIPGEEGILASPAVVAAAEGSNNSGVVNELSYDRKVESGSITFHFDSSTPAASGRGESPENGDGEQPRETQNTSRFGDGTSDDCLTVSNQLHHGPGETSFSAAGPLSGLITYSGPIAYSGSLSLRSDSSTTSTRSFAFPILQSEWNTSPVRMAKADRRHFRKHRGWRQGLLCCRF